MAYYNINGKHIDIFCGNADAIGRCDADCHNCNCCKVEDLDTHKVEPYIGSQYQKGGE